MSRPLEGCRETPWTPPWLNGEASEIPQASCAITSSAHTYRLLVFKEHDVQSFDLASHFCCRRPAPCRAFWGLVNCVCMSLHAAERQDYEEVFKACQIDLCAAVFCFATLSESTGPANFSCVERLSSRCATLPLQPDNSPAFPSITVLFEEHVDQREAKYTQQKRPCKSVAVN